MNEEQMNQGQPEEKSKALAIASMVCGILSLVTVCITVAVSFPLAVIALVLGIVSLTNKLGGKAMAITGIVCAVLMMILVIGVLIVGLSVAGWVTSLD